MGPHFHEPFTDSTANYMKNMCYCESNLARIGRRWPGPPKHTATTRTFLRVHQCQTRQWRAHRIYAKARQNVLIKGAAIRGSGKGFDIDPYFMKARFCAVNCPSNIVVKIDVSLQKKSNTRSSSHPACAEILSFISPVETNAPTRRSTKIWRRAITFSFSLLVRRRSTSSPYCNTEQTRKSAPCSTISRTQAS